MARPHCPRRPKGCSTTPPSAAPNLCTASSRHDRIAPHPSFATTNPSGACGFRVGTGAICRCWNRVRALPVLLPPLLGLLLAACDATPGATDRAFSASGELIAMSGGPGGAANACFTCHGLKGEGDGDAIPRLAGLDQGYLQKQMEDYASGLRPDDVMARVARGLDQDGRRAVAAWYAGLPAPAVMTGAPTPPPSVWLAGDAARGITPCAACHGPAGQGAGAGQPVVAGQPVAYTLEQIDRWKSGKRRNDPRGVMAAAVQRLTDAESRAIAQWLSGQPASPAPASASASASASAAAAARPAALRETRRPDRSDGA